MHFVCNRKQQSSTEKFQKKSMNARFVELQSNPTDIFVVDTSSSPITKFGVVVDEEISRLIDESAEVKSILKKSRSVIEQLQAKMQLDEERRKEEEERRKEEIREYIAEIDKLEKDCAFADNKARQWQKMIVGKDQKIANYKKLVDNALNPFNDGCPKCGSRPLFCMNCGRRTDVL